MTTTNNFYVRLDEVQKILVDYCDELPRHWIKQRGARADMGLKILRLPTIDPIEEIDKMIEEIKNGIDPGHVTMISARVTLEELKRRLSLTQK